MQSTRTCNAAQGVSHAALRTSCKEKGFYPRARGQIKRGDAAAGRSDGHIERVQHALQRNARLDGVAAGCSGCDVNELWVLERALEEGKV